MAMKGVPPRAVVDAAPGHQLLAGPDSPLMSTVAWDWDSRPMARKTSCIAGAWPRISGTEGGFDRAALVRGALSMARRTSSTAWSTSKGLGRYSDAPWKAATALSRSE